ncbi:MAG: alkaline phosphatase family protein [bacterium]
MPDRLTSSADPDQQALNNLHKIDHFVVLMLENRSFDHILGYLKLEAGRREVDGLTRSMSNMHNKKKYTVRHLESTKFEQDPGHEGEDVAEQLVNNNGGFVSDFARHYPDERDPGKIMGYYNAVDLPVYDHLARHFCICDRWFSSVPGSTWPNRLYALTGQADGSKDNKPVPIYSEISFVRHLEERNISWRWYSHDFQTLRYADEKYRTGYDQNFFKVEENTMLEAQDFLDHCASGDLAAVSWIDPNLVGLTAFAANDDHPPADVMAAQNLVLTIFSALIASPAWKKTVFILTYDEHGGFYDHVAPPEAVDDDPNFRSYGVRVPALIISPWVIPGSATHVVFDHTSIIKTILLRFCREADGNIPNMGARVANANHLGELLTLPRPRPVSARALPIRLLDQMARWQARTWKGKILEQMKVSRRQKKLSEFQQGLVAARSQFLKLG